MQIFTNAFVRHMLFLPAANSNKSAVLDSEVRAIHSMLQERAIDAFVSDAYISTCGNFVRYKFAAKTEKARDDLGKIRPDRWLGLVSDKRSNPRKVAASFNAAMLTLDSPYPGEQTVLGWSEAETDGAKRGKVFLGREYRGNSFRPLLLDLTDANAPHLLIVSTTGGGKTGLLRSLILSATSNDSPERVGIVLLDPKGVLPELEGIPHVHRTRDPEMALQSLQAVVAELDRRAAGESSRDCRIIVCIDELYDLIMSAENEVKHCCKRISQVGRELNIHLVGCTQHPTADALDSVVKANFPARAVGRVVDKNASNVAAGFKGLGAEALPGKGSFYLVESGASTRFQTHLISDEDIKAHIAKVVSAHGSEKRRILPDVEAPMSQLDSRAQKVLAHYSVDELLKPGSDASQPIGKRLKRGAQKEVIRLLFNTENTGYGSKAKEAIERAIELAEVKNNNNNGIA